MLPLPCSHHCLCRPPLNATGPSSLFSTLRGLPIPPCLRPPGVYTKHVTESRVKRRLGTAEQAVQGRSRVPAKVKVEWSTAAHRLHQKWPISSRSARGLNPLLAGSRDHYRRCKLAVTMHAAKNRTVHNRRVAARKATSASQQRRRFMHHSIQSIRLCTRHQYMRKPPELPRPPCRRLPPRKGLGPPPGPPGAPPPSPPNM